MGRTDRAERLINASTERIYQALVDPELLVQWLPPEGATGKIDAFDPRPGGAFCMTLTFADAEGKSAADKDVVQGHFVTLDPGRSVSQSFSFDSPDPAFAGEMRMTWMLEPRGETTAVMMTAENVPEGIGREDHEEGLNSSLANLAALVEG